MAIELEVDRESWPIIILVMVLIALALYLSFR